MKIGIFPRLKLKSFSFKENVSYFKTRQTSSPSGLARSSAASVTWISQGGSNYHHDDVDGNNNNNVVWQGMNPSERLIHTSTNQTDRSRLVPSAWKVSVKKIMFLNERELTNGWRKDVWKAFSNCWPMYKLTIDLFFFGEYESFGIHVHAHLLNLS